MIVIAVIAAFALWAVIGYFVWRWDREQGQLHDIDIAAYEAETVRLRAANPSHSAAECSKSTKEQP